jgi:hypothetical protein
MHNKCGKVKLGSTTWVSRTSGLGIEGSTEGPSSAVLKATREANEGTTEGPSSAVPKSNWGSTIEVNEVGTEVGSTIAVEETGSRTELLTSKGLVPLDPCGLGLGLDLDSLAREKRERSAAKADDAAVPEYLWLEHLFDDSTWEWDVDMRAPLLCLVDWFRMHMLRHWRRNVFRSFI